MAKPIGPDLWYHIVGVSDPCLSPDGTRLAFTKSWVDSEKSESRSRIMLMRLPEGRPIELTQGTRDSSPRFSPDGSSIAFLRPDERKVPQVWVLSLSGGEARQLTRSTSRVFELAWSPDGRRVAYVADVDPEPPGDGEEPRVRVVRRIRYRADTLGWRGDAHRHIFVVNVSDGAARQLTDGDWDDRYPVWSPDGTRIAFISGRREDRDIVALQEAYVVSAEGGEPALWSQGLTSVESLAWSPDGTRLAALATEAKEGMLVAWQGWLYVLDLGKPPVRLTDDSVRPVGGFTPIIRAPELRWTADGQVLFLGDARGQTFLFSVPTSGGELRTIAGGKAQAMSVSFDGTARQAAMVAASVGSPSDLYLVDVTSGQHRQLTDYNRAYLAEHPPAYLGKSKLRRAGWEIESRLLMPPDFDDAKRYPLVLDVHGGPNAAWYDSFNATQQVLATAGYLVLAVNPRGSSTYGDQFMRAVLEDWGGEDYLDLMAAVDEVCKRRYVDTSRLGVHGYSYGGYMTSWIVGHTDRFKAAVVGAPVTDLPSMYGTSDIGVSFGEFQWGGTRAEALQKFIERSPLTYAPRVNTPVLLLHGEADIRCPIEQSEQYFVALKRHGKTVEFVRLPECSHLFLRVGHPKMRQEYLARTRAWFDKYLKG